MMSTLPYGPLQLGAVTTPSLLDSERGLPPRDSLKTWIDHGIGFQVRVWGRQGGQ